MSCPRESLSLLGSQQIRNRTAKHWNPKFKRLRKLKFIKIELPKFNEKPTDMSKDELKAALKKRGIIPPRPWMERPFHISSTGGIFEAYVPPEGDGKKSFITTTGAKQKLEVLEKKSKSMMALRKIRNYDEDFNVHIFAETAQQIYIDAHEKLMNKSKLELREFVTERCYPEMIHNIRDKTIHWKFLRSLEPPRVVHIRVTDVISKENQFAQVTVRFNTQQQLAIYDRFGRLMHGSEILAKDVLEYVVFENHISNQYGKWRLHDKIIPDWIPPKEPGVITYRLMDPEPLPIEAGATESSEDTSEDKKLPPPKDEKPQQLEKSLLS